MGRHFFALVGIIFLTACVQYGSEHRVQQRDIIEIFKSAELSSLAVSRSESSILTSLLVLPQNQKVSSLLLLRQDDRLAAAWWSKSDDSKQQFYELKERLFSYFSDDLTDLIDDTVLLSQHFPIDILAFTDPEIFRGRIIIARIQDTLYEFHTDEAFEGDVRTLLFQVAEFP